MSHASAAANHMRGVQRTPPAAHAHKISVPCRRSRSSCSRFVVRTRAETSATSPGEQMSGTPPDLAPHIAPSVVNRLRPPSVWGKEWKGDDERAPGQMPGPPAYPMKQWGAHRVLLQGFNWEVSSNNEAKHETTRKGNTTQRTHKHIYRRHHHTHITIYIPKKNTTSTNETNSLKL